MRIAYEDRREDVELVVEPTRFVEAARAESRLERTQASARRKAVQVNEARALFVRHGPVQQSELVWEQGSPGVRLFSSP